MALISDVTSCALGLPSGLVLGLLGSGKSGGDREGKCLSFCSNAH